MIPWLTWEVSLSSVIVMLDERDNGFLINSVHSTTAGTYTYVKKITDGLADVELAEERQLQLQSKLETRKQDRHLQIGEAHATFIFKACI